MSRVFEKYVSSHDNRREKIPYMRNHHVDVKNIIVSNEDETGERSYARPKRPRLRWTDDLHRRFLHAVAKLGGEDRATPKMILRAMGVEGVTVSHVKSHLQMHRSMRQTIVIQEAIEAANKSGKDTELIAKLPELVKTTSRPVSRRQTRLQTIKAMLVKKAVARHFCDHRQVQPPRVVAQNFDKGVTTLNMPSENGKKSHDYMVFNNLLQNPTTLFTPSTIQGNKSKGKDKVIDEEITKNSGRKLEEFYKEVMNKYKSTTTSNVLDPKLRLEMVCSPVILPPNHHNISLDLTLSNF